MEGINRLKMDFTKFINSKDIAKYLKDIHYDFSPMEAAYVVYQSNKRALKEKHRAWKEVIKTTEDFPLKERINMSAYPSFHGFLTDYMNLENDVIKEYKKDEENAIYEYSFYNDDIDDDSFDLIAYRKYDEIENKIKELNDGTSYVTLVTKRFFYSKKFFNVYYNKRGEILKTETNICDGNEYTEQLYRAFKGMWFNIPTPFKKGDLLCYCKGTIPKDAPILKPDLFVIIDFDYWNSKELENNGFKDGKNTKNFNDRDFEWRDNFIKRMSEHGDDSDMNFTAYYLDNDKILFSDGFFNYLNLEFFNGKCKGYNRILQALSNHVKGYIDDEMFALAFNQILAEEHLKSISCYNEWYHRDDLKLMGLKGERK